MLFLVYGEPDAKEREKNKGSRRDLGRVVYLLELLRNMHFTVTLDRTVVERGVPLRFAHSRWSNTRPFETGRSQVR